MQLHRPVFGLHLNPVASTVGGATVPGETALPACVLNLLRPRLVTSSEEDSVVKFSWLEGLGAGGASAAFASGKIPNVNPIIR